MCEPVGQADLRAAIVSALAQAPGAVRPQFRQCPGHVVFQYLGTIDRPRQIAFTSAQRRLVYDVRENRVRVNDGQWSATQSLDERLRREWLDLVHFWERLRLQSGQDQEEAS
jgi:hypothetical protein